MLPRIALLHPYWDFWASSVPGDLRADRSALLGAARAALEPTMHVVASFLLAPTDDAATFARKCADVDAIVVVSTMAAPPAPTMALLAALGDTPAVVIWALSQHGRLPADFTHSDVTSRGATVGAPMIGSALSRAGLPFEVVLSALADPTDAVDAVRRAGAAGRIKRATLLRLGAPIAGYKSVDASDEALAPLGIQVAHRDPADLAERARTVSATAASATVAQVRAEFDVGADVSDEALDRAARIELALTALMAEIGADAGALNCHLPELRLDPQHGVAPCLALGRLTSQAIPWTCAGDVVTTVAMLAVSALGRPTLYHEVEAVDFESDEVVLANTGEHDLRLCAGRPALARNVWFAGDPVPGACARFTLPAGPASLVAFTFEEARPRFVVAEGSFTGRSAPSTGTPHGGFRFASGPVEAAWAKWVCAGVTHHSVATNALVGADIAAIAHHLGTGVVLI